MRQGTGGPVVLLQLALGFFDLRGGGVARGFADELPARRNTVKLCQILQSGKKKK